MSTPPGSNPSDLSGLSGRTADYELAANVRAVVVLMDGATLAPERLARIDQIVGLFIDSHWRPPRTFGPIQALSYVLRSEEGDPAFVEDVAQLSAALERHLFGDDPSMRVEVKCMLGPADEMERLAAGSVDEFLSAHAADTARAAREADELSVESREPAVAPIFDRWVEGLSLRGIFDAVNKAVLSYGVTAPDPSKPLEAPLYHDFARTHRAPVEELERAALAFALGQARRQAEVGAVAYCIVPLSYETLAKRSRREAYFAQAMEAPPELRRYMSPSVFGAPLSPASGLFLDLVGEARGVFKLIDWQVTSCRVEVELFRQARLHSVSLATPRKVSERGVEFSRFAAMARALANSGVRPSVTGLTTFEDVSKALSAGAHYVSGEAVSAPAARLAPRTNIAASSLPLSADT